VQVGTTAVTNSRFSPFNDKNSLSTESSHSSSSGSFTKTSPSKFRSLEEIYESCSLALLAIEPTCFEDTTKQTEWQNAMLKDMQAIEKNSTWELIKASEGKNVVELKWVFRTKYNANGSIQKHKA